MAFSNERIYGGALTTFPGVLRDDCLRHVVVRQDARPGQETSVAAEADKVVELVLEHARTRPQESLGVIALGASIGILAFLPWLDTSRVRSARYRPLFKQFFWLFVIVCIGLGWLGSKPPEGIYVILARIFTIYYFAFFLVILPLLGIFEKTKPEPNSISDSVLGAKV